MKTLTIDQAMLGDCWRGGADGLESVAECVRAQDVPGWDIDVCRDSYNGGSETGDDGAQLLYPVQYPEGDWLMAIDAHAAYHPDLWA